MKKVKFDFRGRQREIPIINYEEELECKHCKEINDIDITVDSEKMIEVIDDFIDNSDEDEILEWAGVEHLHDYKVIEYINENVELLHLGTMTKDDFITGLLNIAEININLLDIKNLK